MSLTEILLAQFPELPPFAEATVTLEFLQEILSDQPNRLLHIAGVMRQGQNLARDLATTPEWASQLQQIALYHDIGYALPLRRTGFHPVDGAIFMAHQGLPETSIHAVLYHSGAQIYAEYLPGVLEFYQALPPYKPTLLSDAITFCDTQTSPVGQPVTIAQRVKEVVVRYGKASPTAIAMCRAQPEFEEIYGRILEAQLAALNPGLAKHSGLSRFP